MPLRRPVPPPPVLVTKRRKPMDEECLHQTQEECQHCRRCKQRIWRAASREDSSPLLPSGLGIMVHRFCQPGFAGTAGKKRKEKQPDILNDLYGALREKCTRKENVESVVVAIFEATLVQIGRHTWCLPTFVSGSTMLSVCEIQYECTDHFCSDKFLHTSTILSKD